MRFKKTFRLVTLMGLQLILPSDASTNTRFSPTNTPLVSVVNRAFARAQESERVTQANWQRHPKIKAVRQLVQSVNAAVRKSSFKTSKRQFEYCEPYEETLRQMAVDSKGVVRRYEKQAGSDDSSLTWQHYYDDSRRLRFVFISGGAANGARLEHRIYFDESGQRVWESHQYLKGPHYSFPEVWPDEQLQRVDPAKAFSAPSRCPETKVRKQLKKTT